MYDMDTGFAKVVPLNSSGFYTPLYQVGVTERQGIDSRRSSRRLHHARARPCMVDPRRSRARRH